MASHKKKRRAYIIIIAIVILLIIARLLLPSIVLRYANNSLAKIKGYYGHVNNIGISLYRGAYQLDSFYLNKKDTASNEQTPFMSAQTIDLSVQWAALLHGKIVGKIKFLSPKLVFTKEKTEIGQVAKDTDDFRKVLKDFMPLKVNRFEIVNGSIHYVDNTTNPKVDISLQQTYVLAQNLKNTNDNKEKLTSPIHARANAYGGTFNLDMKMDALAKDPTFYLDAEIKNANLVKLNSFFRAYGKFDVSKGTLGLYTEFAAEHGKFKGYVKPFIKDLKITALDSQKNNFFQEAKAVVYNAVASVLKNPNDKTLATKVPIEGAFHHTTIGTWDAVWLILRNAFIEALMPSVDHEININSPDTVGTKDDNKKPGFFKRLFGSKKKKETAEKRKKQGLEKYNTSNK